MLIADETYLYVCGDPDSVMHVKKKVTFSLKKVINCPFFVIPPRDCNNSLLINELPSKPPKILAIIMKNQFQLYWQSAKVGNSAT